MIIQIDDLSAEVFDRSLASGQVAHLARLLRTDRLRRAPMFGGAAVLDSGVSGRRYVRGPS
jgi:hypothetical protein